jgi:hypothetical protein
MKGYINFIQKIKKADNVKKLWNTIISDTGIKPQDNGLTFTMNVTSVNQNKLSIFLYKIKIGY